MKSWHKWLIAAVLLAAPANVWPQAVVYDGQSFHQQLQGGAVGGIVRADSSFRIVTLTSGGNMMVSDADRDRDNITVSAAAINDTVQTGNNLALAAFAKAAWAAESTSVIATYPYRVFAIGVRMISSGAAAADTSEQRFAIQVRAHPTSSFDTTTAVVWHRWPAAFAQSVGSIDSLGHVSNNVGASPNGFSSLFSGEIQVTLSARRGRGAAPFGAPGQTFGGPDGVYFMLTGVRGEQFWAPYTSIRIRQLSGLPGARVRVDFYMAS